MSTWLREPELDEKAQVGLSFITIGYGVVVTAVFPRTPLALMGVAEWFHLGLAAFMLIISYMGYYSNRSKYPVWKTNFFNIPLFQYIISFGILFLYWELGITVPRHSSHSTLTSEAAIILAIFLAYLAWDYLEVTVQESSKYLAKLIPAGSAELWPALAREYVERPGWRPIKTRSHWFAHDARAGRAVTFIFTLLSAGGLLLISSYRVRGTTSVVVVDSIYIISLFAYRYFQWKWSGFWYRRAEAT